MTAYSILGQIFGECDCQGTFDCRSTIDASGGIILWALITLYMFKALGTVCDEYFVPSLEMISEKLELSNDVAGATFMAAGSSAPELFTSIVATFLIVNEGGVGAIIGSAIFNILVIVGATCVFAGQVLHIWWYPLARDCCFYLLSILELALFIMDDETVQWWEALIMFLSYCVYCVYMKYNAKIAKLAKGGPDEDEDMVEDLDLEQSNGVIPSDSPCKSEQVVPAPPDQPAWQDPHAPPEQPPEVAAAFRVSNRANTAPAETANTVPMNKSQELLLFEAEGDGSTGGTGAPYHNTGTVVTLKTDGSVVKGGSKDHISIDKDTTNKESDQSLQLGRSASESQKKTSKEKSESEMGQTSKFKRSQSSVAGTTANRRQSTQSTVSVRSGSRVAWDAADGDTNRVVRSMSHLRKQKTMEQNQLASLEQGDEIKPTSENNDEDTTTEKSEAEEEVTGWRKYAVDPLNVIWEKIMPDPERYWSLFFMSILNIALCTYIMVDAVNRSGCDLHVEPLIMGLIFLAAGTSVPDALGSIAVAQQGEGDMAVANALGSNVFDILLGLGVPWFITAAMGHETVFEGASKDLLYWICILVGVLVLFVGALILNKWKLNKFMGAILMTLYFIHVSVALIRTFVL